MKRLSYSLLTYRLDQLWFPAGLWALFVLIAWFMKDNYDQAFNAACAYLGAVVPLTAGIMAAYALLEDPILELRFATPIPAWKALAERLTITLVVAALGAWLYQLGLAALGISLEALGSRWAIQLVWFIPTLALMALGCTASLAFANSSSGAMLVGLAWLMQLIFRDWFIFHDWARYVLVFFGMLRPQHPSLTANQLVLAALSVILLWIAQILFKRQERYI